MSRIYKITERETGIDRFVRANSLNGAIRAIANEKFTGASATTEELFQAFKVGLEVLDAVEADDTKTDTEEKTS
jgi:hypothetical protein